MTIQYVWYGKLKEDKQTEWIKFWRNEENIRRLNEVMTEGMRFKGVYVVINGTASHDYEIWYELDNWAVLDKDRENPRSTELFKEFFEKFGYTDEWSQTKALRTVHDVKSALGDL